MSSSNETKTNPPHEKGQLDPDKIESEILANERTFLAWVRTNIAVMSLGFVIARFSVWMDEVSFRVNPQILTHRLAISAPLGECMIGLGALLTIFAAWRYHVVNQAIKRGEIEADLQMVIAVTVVILVAATAVIVYMAIFA
jgi:putative membrane protein